MAGGIGSTIADIQAMNAELASNNLAIQKEAHKAALEKSRHDAIMQIIAKIG